MSNTEARIAEVLRKRNASTEQFPITKEDGTEKQIKRLPSNQIDSSVPFSGWVEENPQPKVIRTADQITMSDEQPATADEFVVIGAVTISPSHLTGFQRSFTR